MKTKQIQHTPGPWKVTVESPNYMTVRILPAPDSIEQAWANRCLIEAAPELLAAAKKTLGFIEDLRKSNPGYLGKMVLQDYSQFHDAILELPQAIAKSEGAAQ